MCPMKFCVVVANIVHIFHTKDSYFKIYYCKLIIKVKSK